MTAPLPRQFIVAGFLTLLASGALFASFGALFPGLQQRFALSESAVGFLVTMISLGGILGSSVTGLLEGKVTLRWRILGGSLLASLGLAGLIVSSLWWLILLSSFITGTGTAILNAEINGNFARGFGRRSAAVVTLAGGVFSVGAILGPLLVSFKPSEPHLLFLSVGVVIATTFVLFVITPFSAPGTARALATPTHFPFTPLALFIVIFLMQTSVEIIITSWAATHIIRQGSSPETAARVVSAFWIMVTLARFLAVPITLRVKPAMIIATGFALTFVFGLVAQVSQLTLPAYILMGFSVGSLFPLLIAWMGERLPHAKSATAFALTGASVGAALFPPLAGRMIELTSVSSLPYFIVILTLLGFIFVLILNSLKTRA